MRRLVGREHQKLVNLRLVGKSIPEISREIGVAKTTVLRHVKGVIIPEQYQAPLRERQGGSKERAAGLRANSMKKAEDLLQQLSSRDYLLLLIGLYWGEGTKGDFSLMNSDPLLIQTFISCIQHLGIDTGRLTYSIRIHQSVSRRSAIAFWSKITGLPKEAVVTVEVIPEGKKKGKLQFGMCRVRVKAGIRERLLIQSAIAIIGAICRR